MIVGLRTIDFGIMYVFLFSLAECAENAEETPCLN